VLAAHHDLPSPPIDVSRQQAGDLKRAQPKPGEQHQHRKSRRPTTVDRSHPSNNAWTCTGSRRLGSPASRQPLAAGTVCASGWSACPFRM
jgi:hypothetical protein